jgi:hypothetical protein
MIFLRYLSEAQYCLYEMLPVHLSISFASPNFIAVGTNSKLNLTKAPMAVGIY